MSACSESLDISISLMASLTSSFSTVSIMRRRACARVTRQRGEDASFLRHKPTMRAKERPGWRFRLRCAGTVRPRQVQCPLGWLAIAQVSASQHQLVSSGQEGKEKTGQATVSFAWVCTAAADTHRPTAHPAKLAGTRLKPSNIWTADSLPLVGDDGTATPSA